VIVVTPLPCLILWETAAVGAVLVDLLRDLAWRLIGMIIGTLILYGVTELGFWTALMTAVG
jgi:hypothetical protein